MSELTRRIIFAVIAAPASVGAVYFGDWALAIVLSVLAALGAWELMRMARQTGVAPFDGAANLRLWLSWPQILPYDSQLLSR